MKNKTILAFSMVAMLGVAVFGALGTARMAAATPSDNCIATIKVAIADRRVSSSEREAIQDACGSTASEHCLAVVKTAIADKKITQAEVQAIKAACFPK